MTDQTNGGTMIDQTKPKPGCYVDGFWGQYGAARVVEIANDLGWGNEQAGERAARHLASLGPSDEPGLSDDEHELLLWDADNAETFLNDCHAEPDHFWGWHDGEFFYESGAWWEEG